MSAFLTRCRRCGWIVAFGMACGCQSSSTFAVTHATPIRDDHRTIPEPDSPKEKP